MKRHILIINFYHLNYIYGFIKMEVFEMIENILLDRKLTEDEEHTLAITLSYANDYKQFRPRIKFEQWLMKVMEIVSKREQNKRGTIDIDKFYRGWETLQPDKHKIKLDWNSGHVLLK